MSTGAYDPFLPGPSPVGVRTIQAHDRARDRVFPCELWYPARSGAARQPAGPHERRDAAALPGTFPLIVFSHHSGGHRRSASFLGTHLARHGYVVAAMDHSEVVAADLARREGETAARQGARVDAVIASRVPDVRFLLDHLLEGRAGAAGPGAVPVVAGGSGAGGDGGVGIGLDVARIGLVGHSLGGWTALAAPEVDPRVGAVVALAPGGSSHPKPGILPLKLTFAWDREVATLYLAAEDDRPIPPANVADLFDRTPAPRRMFILRRADHQHFVDDVEHAHEAVRAMSLPGEAAWIPRSMRPISELCSGQEAHAFVRGLTLAHLDATLRRHDDARRFLDGDVEAELAARGVEALAYHP